jgi:hypothetical protein
MYHSILNKRMHHISEQAVYYGQISLASLQYNEIQFVIQFGTYQVEKYKHSVIILARSLCFAELLRNLLRLAACVLN